MVREILLLGNERLYEPSEPVTQSEAESLKSVVSDMHDTLMDYRRRHGVGRAIAAPQVGVSKRLIYMHIDRPVVFFNPELAFPDGGMMRVLDDCMSFPGLYVYVMRHRRCSIRYLDGDWKPCRVDLEGDLSELLQHEYDHLDGILATMRAVDSRSFVMKAR
jgi:peptide deformylase